MTMKEFGSDFHFMTFPDYTKEGKLSIFNNCILYADGRNAFQDLLKQKISDGVWERIWIPEYFCYEVIKAIKLTGIEIAYYPDTPLENDNQLISEISFRKGDALLRMNYFGLRKIRDNHNIPVEIIEDHSHDLCSEWAINSNADWCVGSLRKTMPIPEGGILWSPKHSLNFLGTKESTTFNENTSNKRLLGMLLKSFYLENKITAKDDYRRLMTESEYELALSDISGISTLAKKILDGIPLMHISRKKRENWNIANAILSESGYCVLAPQDLTKSTPFSLVLKFKDALMRNAVRKELINRNIYPSILWKVPENASKEVYDLSCRLLSVHCDSRYSTDEINSMTKILIEVLNTCK